LDLCQEGVDYLLGDAPEGPAAPRNFGGAERGARSELIALGRRERDLAILRDPRAYRNPDRYRRAVHGLNSAMRALGRAHAAVPTLADYHETSRRPQRRTDLLEAAAAYDENLYYPLFSRRIAAELEAAPEESIGISLTFFGQALCAFAIVGFIRSRWPSLRIVLGGGLVTSWIAQGSLARSDTFGGLIDRLVQGRGEDPLAEWLGLPGKAPSVAPDFSDFASLRYIAPTLILPYNFSWGCPWMRCSFCPERAEKSSYSAVSADEAGHQVAQLVDAFGPGLLHFTDNEISPLHLRSLAARPPGAAWYGFARFTPHLADRGFCRALAASGCVMLQLGLESADQSLLDTLDKGITLDLVAAALRALSEASIAVYLYLLFGTPQENRDSALRTRDFVAAQAPKIAFLNAAVFAMPIAGPDAAVLSSHPFYEGDLSLYRDFDHPEGWDRSHVRRFLSEEFEGISEIRRISLRTPPVFTSSHDAFFLEQMQPGLAPGQGSAYPERVERRDC
ncbi:MAG TPA: radical SAM protein, partial [Rectinemataceae bacterium]|nr:radical SAM protein [Rectinemataceae bacterium]